MSDLNNSKTFRIYDCDVEVILSPSSYPGLKVLFKRKTGYFDINRLAYLILREANRFRPYQIVTIDKDFLEKGDLDSFRDFVESLNLKKACFVLQNINTIRNKKSYIKILQEQEECLDYLAIVGTIIDNNDGNGQTR